MSAVSIAGRVVTPGGVVPGWVEIDGGRIARVDGGSPPRGARAGEGWTIVPGFVDVHVHGGGGHSVTTGQPASVLAAADLHRRHGTTTTLVSFVTAPADDLLSATRSVADFLADASPADRRRIAGIHFEGPFLSAARCGAQNPEHMTDPVPELIDTLIAAGQGHVKVMTIAPERRGAIDAVRQLDAAGVIAAIGHSDATYAQAREAVDAGARLATHLGNAMSPLGQREPGVVGACLTSPTVACELILDGHHLHPAFVQLAAMAKDDESLVLITDAMAAAGQGDGMYVLGAYDVEVRGGVARLGGGGSLAGSTLTMDGAFRTAVLCGLTEVAASRAASLNPARLLGIDTEVGSIDVGKRADLVVLDEGHDVVAVVVAGDVVAGTLEPA